MEFEWAHSVFDLEMSFWKKILQSFKGENKNDFKDKLAEQIKLQYRMFCAIKRTVIFRINGNKCNCNSLLWFYMLTLHVNVAVLFVHIDKKFCISNGSTTNLVLQFYSLHFIWNVTLLFVPLQFECCSAICSIAQ